MIITFQQIIALLPLLIVGFTVIFLMLCISWRCKHFINAMITVIGLNLALLSLWFVAHNGPIDVTPLIRVDGYSIFYTGLVLISSLGTVTLAYTWLSEQYRNQNEFYILVLIAAIGAMILTCANHLAALFLGIELISLPIFGMIGYEIYHKRSLEASIKYTLLSGVSASFLLFGMAIVYACTGHLSFVEIGKTINDEMLIHPILLTGLGMMIVSIGFKLSLVPFHLWTPDVYQGAPSPVSAFLATASKIAMFAVIMRFFLYAPFIHSRVFQIVIAIISLASILFGNLMAVNQINIKRVLGYSSISHVGYLLVGLMAVQSHTLALETIGIYLSGYMFANLGAFGVISLLSHLYPGKDVDSLYFYRGLFWHKPLLSLIMTVMMLSLAGIPMTLGFIGKFYVIALSVHSHFGWITSAILAGSIIGLVYYFRIMVSLYFSPEKNLHSEITPHWSITAGNIVMIITSLLVIIFGISPQPLITLVQLAHPVI